MQAAVEESKKAKQPAEAHQPGEPRREPAQRSDGQRDDQQAKSSKTGGMGNRGCRVRPKIIGESVVDQHPEWGQASKPHRNFESNDGAFVHVALSIRIKP